MGNQYDWVEFYSEFAKKLLPFKDKRTELIEKIKTIYDRIEISLPKLEKDNNIVDIDPFTIFGLFNKGITTENRIKVLTAIAEDFDIEATVPTSFDSLPVLNNQNATFYYFIGERGEHDIDDLWELFDFALQYADDPSMENRKKVSKYFDLTINRKGNGNSKITMGLYWISPSSFLNLDQRNIWYIYKSGKVPADVVNTLPEIEFKIPSDKYFDIIEKLRAYLNSEASVLKDFKDLSFEAWRYSTEVNEQKKAEKNQILREEKGSGLADEDVDTIHYWIYSPGDGACKWDEFYEKGVMGIGWGAIGDFRQYDSKEDMKKAMKEKIDPSRPYINAAHATWQFANVLKLGDVVFVKKGMHQLVGRGVVESDYYYDDSEDTDFPNFRKMNWTDKGEWEHPGQAVMKTLTDITSYTEYVGKLCALFDNEVVEDDTEAPEITYPPYTVDKFLEEVYMDRESYNTLVGLIRNKKNVILQGAPGVGKTYAAKRLAYSMMGVKDQERVMLVQFHQSYGYEDFIEGFRPAIGENNFVIKKGAFCNFCNKAAEDRENDYFFIIDEINRGNLSKIFGELFMLIENDKRNNALRLLYSGDRFFVPDNVYVIGMMNTADRSLAMLDYALRRRFAFYEMTPGFETDGFKTYRIGLKSDKFDSLINCVENLNNAIAADESLGDGFCIGHSYFCNIDEVSEGTLSNIVEYELVPLLKEYWFDEPSKVKDWTNNLRSAIK